MIKFIESDEHEICLTGFGGVGKSLIASMLYDVAKDNGLRCCFVSPTNKAKLVIASKGDSNRNASTIHSLLNLRPNLDILEFDATDLQFDFGFIKSTSNDYNILIVDECSMINDELYEVLKDKFKNSHIVYSGDSQQLSPVKQKSIAKPFKCRTLTLTKIYRQKESALQKVLNYLRKKPLYKFKNVSDDNGNIIVYNNLKEMLNNHAGLFKIAEDFNDKNLVKLVTYTNKRITALNTYIRKCIYPTNAEYQIREVLTGYDTCNIGNHTIENSKDYIVKNIVKTNLYSLPAYIMNISDGLNEFTIRILARECPEEPLKKLADNIEKLRLKAVKSKKKLDWKKFYDLYNSFLLPFDLYYENRVIKRKSLDYGYCISAHRSQSSQYSIVMIDMENLLRCPNPEELRQLQYVACSRTMSDLIIYQKDD